MPVYMNWGNSVPPKLRGSVTMAGRVGWVEVASLNWGDPYCGSGPNRLPAPILQEAFLTINDPQAQTAFIRIAAGGEKNKTDMLLDFTSPGDDANDLRLRLSEAYVTRLSMEGGQQSLSVNLQFRKIAWGNPGGVMSPGLPPYLNREIERRCRM